MGRDRISLNGRRRLRLCHRPHPPFLRSVIPPSLGPGSLLQSGIASESPEGEGRERVLAPSTPSTTAIPKLWPPYSDKSGGRRVKPEGRKGTGGRDPEAGGKRHKKPEPAGLSDQAPSIPAALPTFVRGNGSHHPRCSRAARHSCFPPPRSLPTSQSPPIRTNQRSRRARKSVLIFIRPQGILGIKKVPLARSLG